ncbi:MAG: hypothetical protein HQL82_11995 [Magnetococcales bacterium]|nr:hypothetical protein [Magnetococcales bacterium]
MSEFTPKALRTLCRSLPGSVEGYFGHPQLQNSHLYLPSSHLRALDPKAPLVVGMRGAGKTFWWQALFNNLNRAVQAAATAGRVHGRVVARACFGERTGQDDFPTPALFRDLLNTFSPEEIWRTIIGFHLFESQSALGTLSSWSQRAAWTRDNVEPFESELRSANQTLRTAGEFRLLMFDAMDTTSRQWQGDKGLQAILRALLALALEFRNYSAFGLKVFVRQDMLDSQVLAFPDASKLYNNKVELTWPRRELYGLLWQYLGNQAEGETFRNECHSLFQQRWQQAEDGGAWLAPPAMNQDEDLQEKVFIAMAGRWMGHNQRRGKTYSWLPNHLADAHAQTSPRSFLAAVLGAAENTPEDNRLALHFDGIKRGVQKASQIRVAEMAEDYPWVEKVMERLRGEVVPCEFGRLAEKWSSLDILGWVTRPDDDDSNPGRPLPGNLTGSDPKEFREALIQIGIFQSLHDGRINIPDVYRIGFGLGRRGGVRPVR